MNGRWHDIDTYNADKNVEVWNENIKKMICEQGT